MTAATGGDESGAEAGAVASISLPARPVMTSVLQHHGNLQRDGNYVEPSFTKTAVRSLALEGTFNMGGSEAVYAQPVYIEKGSAGKDVIIVASESNTVFAVDGGTGNLIWKKNLGPSVSKDALPCGNISPLGITGTPAVDAASNTFILDSMQTPDGGRTKHHIIYRLSVADGSVVSGWPIDVGAQLHRNQMTFDSEVQNERGAVAIVNGVAYVPYGGHWGDCGDYHGWIVAVPLSSPNQIKAWHTRAKEGGIWAPGGISSDGKNIYFATGNTDGADQWSDGEAVFRMPLDLNFQPTAENYFTPSNWKELDDGDQDVGGVAPVLVDVPKADGHAHLVLGFGKDGKIYVGNRDHMGGIGGALLAPRVSSSLITAPTAYTTSKGTFVAFKGTGQECPGGQSGDLTAVKIVTTPQLALTTAWCAQQGGMGSPMVSTTDGHANAIVWSLGAEGDGFLKGFDGETGRQIFQSSASMDGIQRYQTPILVKGGIFVVGGGKIYKFSLSSGRGPSSTSKKSQHWKKH